MRKRYAWLIGAAATLAAAFLIAASVLCGYSAWQNRTIHITEYTVSHKEIPSAFDGKRIVHLTDLHNKDFGDELTDTVASLKPDIIVITGDWIGMVDTDITVAKQQATALAGIAPIYYVAGNHEATSTLREELFAHLKAVGITLLENSAVVWEEDGQSIQLLGMFDPEFSTHLWRDFAPLVQQELYNVLLFHRPEYLEEAASFGADLIFSGHTHGGQIRLPLIGAVFAPNQGFFPTYDVGRFESGDTTMIIGQGLGESVYVRILTPPEIVVVTLEG